MGGATGECDANHIIPPSGTWVVVIALSFVSSLFVAIDKAIQMRRAQE
jgi:hypothetical protein